MSEPGFGPWGWAGAGWVAGKAGWVWLRWGLGLGRAAPRGCLDKTCLSVAARMQGYELELNEDSGTYKNRTGPPKLKKAAGPNCSALLPSHSNPAKPAPEPLN